MKRLLTALGVLTCSVLLSAQERVTLLFVGDLMQHSGQIEAARTADGEYDYRECFSLVKDLIAGADIAVGNLEVTLGGRPYTGYPTFSAPDEYLHALADAGFDVLLTANNHSLDRGRRGLERTLMMLDSLGLHHTGTYRDDSERRRRTPLVVDAKGFRIAFLNYTYGTNGIRATHPNVVDYTDKDVIRQDIARARALRPDAIIACMHWGDEYQSLPNARQKELADWLLREGVTHVIGSHPHVLQPMEVRRQGCEEHVVVYSLGNFISNMSARGTDGGAILLLQLEKFAPLRAIPPRIAPDRSLPPLPAVVPGKCRLSACGYRLVWTARPRLTGWRNYRLIPDTCPADSLPPQARQRMQRFLDDTRRLFHIYNNVGEWPR